MLSMPLGNITTPFSICQAASRRYTRNLEIYVLWCTVLSIIVTLLNVLILHAKMILVIDTIELSFRLSSTCIQLFEQLLLFLSLLFNDLPSGEIGFKLSGTKWRVLLLIVQINRVRLGIEL